MKFSDWKLLEKLNKDFFEEEANKVKEIIGNRIHDLYVVKGFETFKRIEEPEQQNNIFTDKELRTFSMNYTTKGTLYSVDFWKKNGNKPFVTLYVSKGSFDEIVNRIPDILHDPRNASEVTTSKSKIVSEATKFDKEEPTDKIDLDPAVVAAQQIFKEDDYEYGNPETIYEDLRTYVRMVVKGNQPSLIITGPPGQGKSYEVLNTLKAEGLRKDEDFFYVKGRSTAAGLFITLAEHKDQLIVFDDCDSVFGPQDSVSILKTALDSYDEREITWATGKPLRGTSNQKVPTRFLFTGKIIFISNLSQKAIDKAIKSRSFVLEVAITPEDMLNKMEKELPKVMPEVSMIKKEKALRLIKKVSKKSDSLELSMRTLVKAIRIVTDISDQGIAERFIMQQCNYK